jgi:hypothetical protein
MNWNKSDFDTEFDKRFRDAEKRVTRMWLVNTICGIIALAVVCGGGSWLAITLAQIIFGSR